MQTFIDTATQQQYAFDDDVKVTQAGSVYSFSTALDEPILTPTTLQPNTPAPVVPPNAAQLAWLSYQGEAQDALNDSDITVLRCAENSVTVPAEWVAYRKSLRAIVSAGSGDPTQPLPKKPDYPSGT